MTANRTFETRGQNGGQVISNTSAQTGDWVEIRVITAAVFTSLTGNVTNVGSLTYPAGFVIPGRFSALQLASGSVLAVHAP